MLRHVAEPFDAGGFHGGVAVQALGDGAGDDGLALFFQQFNQSSLLLHQPVNLRRLSVKELGDRALLGEWRNQYRDRDEIARVNCWITHACRSRNHLLYKITCR